MEKKTTELAKITPSELLTTYSIKELRTSLAHVKTIEDSINAKTPTIGMMVRSLGANKIESYIKMWLINLNQSLNLKRGLSEAQIDECSFLLVNEYSNLTVSDINLIFKNAKLGKYGEFFESLTLAKIMLWFRMYFEERCQASAILSEREASQYKYRAERNNMPEQIKNSVALNSNDLNQLNK